MTISDSYMIERQGKRYVLYAGLLEEAHSRGLRSIETELLEKPWENDEGVAIVRAIVRTDEGKFTGIGDASRENVTRTILPHLIRMAETRAKARALRDAINVGVTAFEELGDGDGDAADTPPQRQKRTTTQQSDKSPGENGGQRDPSQLPATKKQRNYLEALIEDAVEDGKERFEETVGKSMEELTREEASEWIGRLSGRSA